MSRDSHEPRVAAEPTMADIWAAFERVLGRATCPDCVTCTECGRVAYCLAEHGAYPPCEHDSGVCGDCQVTTCAECMDDLSATLEAAYARDPLANRDATADLDPWGPLAAEDRAITDRFWSTVGERREKRP